MYIQSPISYAGNKGRLFRDLWKRARYHRYDTFVDVFTGSMTVGINMLPKADKIICNDTQVPLILLYETLCRISWEELNDFLLERKERVNGKTKVGWFDAIAKEYNNDPQKNILDVLLLSHCCYNGILSFKGMKFTGHSGNRFWGNAFLRDVKEFHRQLHENRKKFRFTSKSFHEIDYKKFKQNDLLYFDPPYFVTNTFYNTDWTREQELKLYEILDFLNERKVNWMLSNATSRGAQENDILLDWLDRNTYRSYTPDITYNAGNEKVQEILVYKFHTLF